MGAFFWPCLRSVRNCGGKTGIANKLNLSGNASFLSYAAGAPITLTITRSGFAGPSMQGRSPQPLAVTGRNRQNRAARMAGFRHPISPRPLPAVRFRALNSPRLRRTPARSVAPAELRPGHSKPLWDCIYVAERYNHHRRLPREK